MPHNLSALQKRILRGLAGEEPPRALKDAELKDGGFSTVTLAWVLKDMPIRALGLAAGADDEHIAERLFFRSRLMTDLLTQSRPTHTNG